MNLFQRKDLYGLCVVLCAASCLSIAPFAGAQSTPQARVVQSVRNDQLITLRGNVHPMARAANDRGELPGTQSITRMTLLLQRSAAQETALEQLLAEQQDPKSPNYHAWLTPQQFGEQFGPADSDIETLKGWLSSQGFSNLRITKGKTMITFDGTAGQVRNAFHTGIHRLSVSGREHFANMEEPAVPEALAPVIAGVFGLHNFHPQPQVKRLGKFQRNRKTGEITPLFTFTDVNGTFFGVGPADFKTIYNVPSTLDGTGVSIAVVGQSNINLQDVADFRTIFGLAANQPTVILNGPDPGLVSGDEGESDLDVQWAGAIAPNASIKFVTTQSSTTDGVSGVDASASYIVDNNVAPILSESYGACETGLGGPGGSGNVFYQLLWQQAAAQGITVVVSAGDNGSAGCDDPNTVTAIPADGKSHLAVSGIASTPFNVAMGGTDFNQANQQSTYWNSTNSTGGVSAKGYIPEMVWNDSCASSGLGGCNSVTSSSTSLNIVAGSGGPSAVYSKPPWQSNGITGMPGDGKRDLPDVSLFSADGNNKSFYIVCQSDADIAGDTGCNLTKFGSTSPFHDFQAVGGTSAAAPAFAGIMALINQKTGQRQGNANPSLYALGKAEAYSGCDSSQGTSGKSSNTTCVFNDITGTTSKDGLTPTLNNSVPCAGAATNCSKTSSGGFGVLTSGGSPAFTAGSGYDLATGLGTPNVANLINAWAAISATGSASATVTLSPATVTGTAGTVSGNLSGTVSGGSGTPTGVVILENSATGGPLQSDGLSGGSYSVAAAMLPAGTYSVKAHYSGDATYAPKDSSPISVSLSKQNSTVLVSFVNAAGNLVTGNQTVAYGSDYILRIDVGNAGGTPCQNSSGVTVFVCPSGTIALKDNGSALTDFPNAQNANASASAKLNDRGFAEDQPIQLNVGAHAITAAYTADAASSYNSNSSSNTLSVTITQATTSVTLTPSVTSVVSGGSITLTAVVNSQSNSAQGPTGTVQFKNGSTNLGAAATCTPKGADSNGSTMVGALCTAQLTTTLSALPPGFFMEPRPRNTPFVVVTLVAAMLAVLSFLLALKFSVRRRRFAYAGAIFALITAAALAGCNGGSPSGGGGGGGGSSSRTISAAYSGDSNYAASSGSTSVTVQ
jgi:subtilase family serine protease